MVCVLIVTSVSDVGAIGIGHPLTRALWGGTHEACSRKVPSSMRLWYRFRLARFLSPPCLPRALHRTHVEARFSPVDHFGAGNRFVPHLTLISIRRQPEATEIDHPVADGRVLGELAAEHHQIVLVTQPGLSPMQHPHVVLDTGAAFFEQAEFVPQGLHLFTPFVEILGPSCLAGTVHGHSSAPVRATDAFTHDPESTVCRAPSARSASTLLQFVHDLWPCTIVLGSVHDVS